MSSQAGIECFSFFGLKGGPAEGLSDRFICNFFGNLSGFAHGCKLGLELSNAVVHLKVGIFQLGGYNLVKFLSLGVIKIQLRGLSFLLLGHVDLPVVDTLLEPLLHKASVALQLVDLNAAHLLLLPHFFVTVLFVELGSLVSLSHLFIVKFLNVDLKINFLLGAV